MKTNTRKQDRTCKDCKFLKSCLESSMRYPCKDFKLAEPAILEKRGRK